MQHIITINVGVRDAARGAIISQDRDKALNLCVSVFGAGTVKDTLGAWRDDSGARFVDVGLEVTVVTDALDPKTKTRELAELLRNAFSQQCVLVTINPLAFVKFV